MASSPTLPRYSAAARQTLRALRGRRSQVAFARRLGYRGNPITDWENGRRHPTASEVLRAAALLGRPVASAFSRLHPTAAPVVEEGAWQLAPWLNGLRGATPIVELASRLGHSRFTISRWLAGTTQLRFAEFLHVADVLTGRVHEFVAELVNIEFVAALEAQHRQALAAQSLARTQPWTEAILRVLETEAYHNNPQVSHATLAACLGLPDAELEAALRGLQDAGIVERDGARYVVVGTLTVDTRASAEALARVRRHWLTVAAQRNLASQDDWFAYNLLSVSQADLKRIQNQLKQTYRETRSIVAASEPPECAALLVVQLSRFPLP